MLVQPSFDEVQEEVTPGTYAVRVAGASEGSWSTGTPYINWRLETFGEEDPKNNGRSIWHKTPISGKGVFRLQQFYKAAVGERLAGQFDTDQVLGKELEVEVSEREYNGKMYTDVAQVRARA